MGKKFPIEDHSVPPATAFNIYVCCHIGAPGIATIGAVHSQRRADHRDSKPTSASSDFSRGYYQRIAERYHLLAEGGSDLPHDEASPSISPAACSPPSAMEPKLAEAADRGFVQVMLKVARRVSLLPSRRAD
jgi:hypothetical protein